MPLVNHLRRKAGLHFAVPELLYQSMQSNELYYHKTRAICKIVHLPDLGENSAWCYVNEDTAWIRTQAKTCDILYEKMVDWGAKCCLWDCLLEMLQYSVVIPGYADTIITCLFDF